MLSAVISAMPNVRAPRSAVLSEPLQAPDAPELHPARWLELSSWLEQALMQVMLGLVLWPLKLIYRRPQETWRAWFANQKLCSLDRRFC